MNLKKSTSKTQSKSHKKSALVSDSVGSYEKHPFFIKKAAAAKAFLLRVGLPKEFASKKHA